MKISMRIIDWNFNWNKQFSFLTVRKKVIIKYITRKLSMKKFATVTLMLVLFTFSTCSIFGQGILLGPRVTGNMNIYNQKNLTGTWNGIGVGIGGQLDLSFSKHIGLMVDLTAFDMKNFSNSTTANNVTTDESLTLSYLTIDPMFKLDFSGFYMVAGPSLGIKLASSGDVTTSGQGQAANDQTVQLDTKSVIFNIALGTGYTFALSPGSMYMGTDFMVYIPLSDTYNFPGQSNSVLSLKLGVSLKFNIL
jgi:hypothetical protein